MTISISPEEMEKYKRTARERWQAEQAWELARRAAALLREQFDVPRVMVFGSLVHPDGFTLWSDVDLAVWGLTSSNWLKAIGAVRRLPGVEEIELDIVDVTMCSDKLLAVIEREGKPL
jgi:predicted nucleotidyltransferase